MLKRNRNAAASITQNQFETEIISEDHKTYYDGIEKWNNCLLCQRFVC